MWHIILVDDIEVFLFSWIIHICLLDTVKTLPLYTNEYRKEKSLDEFTLQHIPTLKDINQSDHYILAVINDDKDTLFDNITLELLIIVLYQHDCSQIIYTEWIAESLK